MSEKRQGSEIGRREFLTRSAAALAAGAGAGHLLGAGESPAGPFHPLPPSKLPTRPLGRTGAQVSVLSFGGGGPWFSQDRDTALRLLTAALDGGVNLIDTAVAYGDGISEQCIGELMPARRKQVLVITKISTRDPELWKRHLEASLKRLRADYLDVLMIHHLEHDQDLEQLEAKGGPLEQLYRAKEQKIARWIGFSNHAANPTLLRFIERHRMDVVMMALNVATNGHQDRSFEEVALPACERRELGVVAMKVMGRNQFVGKHPQLTGPNLLRYVLTLPVDSAVITMPSINQVYENLETARNFKPLSGEELAALRTAAEGGIKSSFLEFLRTHRDLA